MLFDRVSILWGGMWLEEAKGPSCKQADSLICDWQGQLLACCCFHVEFYCKILFILISKKWRGLPPYKQRSHTFETSLSAAASCDGAALHLWPEKQRGLLCLGLARKFPIVRIGYWTRGAMGLTQQAFLKSLWCDIGIFATAMYGRLG